MFTLSILALAALARAQNLFEGSGYRATVYYGLHDGGVCDVSNGGPFPDNWAADTINMGVPFCNDNTDHSSLNDWDTNRIVALDWNMLSADKAKWCGKEVQIFDPSGKQITIDEGPFIIWDACAACMTSKIIDLSAKAFVAASPDGKCGNNPEGLSFKVLDNDIRHTLGAAAPPPQQQPEQSAPPSAAPSEDAPSSEDASKTSSTASSTPDALVLAAHQPPPQLPTDEPVVASKPEASAAVDAALDTISSVWAEHTATPAAAPSEQSAAPTECKFGAWRCDNLALQVCNYQTTTTVGWTEVAKCASECRFTESGSAVCL